MLLHGLQVHLVVAVEASAVVTVIWEGLEPLEALAKAFAAGAAVIWYAILLRVCWGNGHHAEIDEQVLAPADDN